MPTHDAPTKPEKDALGLLLARYRVEHSQYLRRKQALNFVIGGGFVAGPVWLLMLTTHLLWGWLKPVDGGMSPTVYLPVLAVLYFGSLLYIWLRILQARRRLNAAKNDIDSIGYFVVCDLSRHVYDPMLVLTDATPPEGKGTVFRPFEPIDFARYDRAFRVH